MSKERRLVDMGRQTLIEDVLRKTERGLYTIGELKAMTNEQLLALIPSPGELDPFEPLVPTHGEGKRLPLPHRRGTTYSRPP